MALKACVAAGVAIPGALAKAGATVRYEDRARVLGARAPIANAKVGRCRVARQTGARVGDADRRGREVRTPG